MDKRKQHFSLLLIATCLLSAQGRAFVPAEPERPLFYLGGTLGQAYGEVGADEMNRRMAELGYEAQAKVSGQDRTAWNVFGGYNLSDYVALELGYVDLGEVRTRLSGSPVDIADYLNSANLVHPRSASGAEVAALARFPFNDKHSVYLRGGWLFANSSYVANANSEFAKRSDKDGDGFYGVGYAYEINRRWGLQVGYERFKVEDENIGMFGLGLRYKFYAQQKPQPVVVSVAQPQPQPQVVSDPQPLAAPVSLKLAVQFDTNSALVKPDFMADVIKLAELMKQHPQSKVVIEGHTDNQGGNQANQILSQKRAESVRNILVEKYAIAADRVSAVGYGEEKPIASNTTSEGRAQNRRVMAELVP
jgi:OmpA-OmpF porin, OOP family